MTCWPWRHQWGKWTDSILRQIIWPQTGCILPNATKDDKSKPPTICERSVQTKGCVICGLKKMRSMWS